VIHESQIKVYLKNFRESEPVLQDRVSLAVKDAESYNQVKIGRMAPLIRRILTPERSIRPENFPEPQNGRIVEFSLKENQEPAEAEE
jgi:hypothetical protein